MEIAHKKSTDGSVLKTIFSRTFIAISLINLLGMTAYYTTFVMMMPYCVSEFNASTSLAGLITGIVVIGCLVGRFFSGKIVRSFGFLKLLVCGLMLYAASTAYYPFITSAEVMFVNRIINGCAVGIVGTVTGTLAAVVTPVRYQGRGIAYFSMSTALALCIGPFLSISLLDWVGASGLFWVATSFTFCNLFLVLFVRVTKTEYRKEKKKLSIKDFIEPSIIPFCLVVTLICVAWGNMQAYMAPYSEENNVQAAAAFFFVVYAVAMLISRPFTGKICDTHSPQLVFYPSIVCLGLGLVCLWAGANDFYVLLAGFLAGLGFGNITSVGQTTAVSMVPRNQYTQATSTFYIFFDMGTGLAPYLSGFLIPMVGYNGIFGLTSILAFGCIPLYWLAMSNYKKASLGVALQLEPMKTKKH